jgi:hypothetical protein
MVPRRILPPPSGKRFFRHLTESRYITGAGGQAFTDGNLMGTSVEHAQIEREQYQDEGVEAHPD